MYYDNKDYNDELKSIQAKIKMKQQDKIDQHMRQIREKRTRTSLKPKIPNIENWV